MRRSRRIAAVAVCLTTLGVVIPAFATTSQTGPAAASAAPVLNLNPQGCAKLPSAVARDYETRQLGVFTVASYNITGQNTTGMKPWQVRRSLVRDFIVDCMPDVVGLQEASAGQVQGTSTTNPQTQYDDLLTLINGRLRKDGYDDFYAVTDVVRNNCGKITDRTRCIKDTNYGDGQVGSNDTRVIYNTKRLVLDQKGFKYLPSLNKTTKSRFVSWATFRTVKTNRPFFFANTHLESNAGNAYRVAEMKTLLAAIKARNPRNYPMVLVGDLNSSRYSMANTAADMPPASSMKIAEILGHDRTTYRPKHSAKYRGSCKVKTKGYRVPYTAAARQYPYYDTSNRGLNNKCIHKPTELSSSRRWTVNGSPIDYIFTSQATVRPRAWATKANMNGKGGYQGVLPSDHNMIMATLVLP